MHHFAMMHLIALLVLGLVMFGCGEAAAEEEVVDVELVLAADVSLSMQLNELETQRNGYAAALVDHRVIEAISKGLHQKIALTYVEWAGEGIHRTIVPWMVIGRESDARQAADLILAKPASGLRRTSISSAIDHTATLFEGNGFRGLKRVIDISGDGPNNQGRPVTSARDEAVAKGIIINGLPLIMEDQSYFGSFDIPDLDLFYTYCVIGGPGSFMVPVNDWDQFPEAVRRKLVLELAQNIEPQVLPIVQVAQSQSYDCLIGEKMWQQRQLYLDVQ